MSYRLSRMATIHTLASLYLCTKLNELAPRDDVPQTITVSKYAPSGTLRQAFLVALVSIHVSLAMVSQCQLNYREGSAFCRLKAYKFTYIKVSIHCNQCRGPISVLQLGGV